MAGVATLGAAALTLGLATTDGGSTSTTDAAPASATQVKETHTDITNQNAGADQKVKDATAKLGTKTEKAEKSEKKGDKAESKAKADRKDKPAANRSSDRKPTYADNLDGWIRESLAIMKDKGIPGSYEGLHRNIIRESAGDPKAINDWDINAINGVPSKGLLQVIPPTFDAYHVKGTPKDIYDPVANITAAANYAADKYGSMDNVDSAY
ncbi:transglycosylase SLT domain-containing protein [Streptomyces sp. SCSIO ZS0520]|uniref:transglycosylase SLT domain-containing protein n=1 Tax=Streptomyces sp. SCSIO ZS0520 TaxID=2892996 RepID=UPI0021D9A6D7|nr:transglycosylase SLT domain-containing protein [Streptomyces sp. SCSIO ZS0520]